VILPALGEKALRGLEQGLVLDQRRMRRRVPGAPEQNLAAVDAVAKDGQDAAEAPGPLAAEPMAALVEEVRDRARAQALVDVQLEDRGDQGLLVLVDLQIAVGPISRVPQLERWGGTR
jgi:hypothetical protein